MGQIQSLLLVVLAYWFYHNILIVRLQNQNTVIIKQAFGDASPRNALPDLGTLYMDTYMDTQDSWTNLNSLKLDISENLHLKTQLGTLFMSIGSM